MQPLESTLEDYIWGRVSEAEYLSSVARADSSRAESLLSRVSTIDAHVNKQLRKGVEENLSRLLEQTTALESLERRQRSVDAHMNEVKQSCDVMAKLLSSQLASHREAVNSTERLLLAKQLLADAARCEELMANSSKFVDVIKKAESLCEIRAIVKENRELEQLVWLKPTIGEKLNAAVKEVADSAVTQLHNSLSTLNSSGASSCLRALQLLGIIDHELEVIITKFVAEVDSSLLKLYDGGRRSPSVPASQGGSSLLSQTVNEMQSRLEQTALLGEQPFTKFCERLARTLRARVQAEAEYSGRLVQSLSRMLSSLRASSAVAVVEEALRPLKHSLVVQASSRLQLLVSRHDFSSILNPSSFVQMLNSAMEDELRRLEWDSSLRSEAEAAIGRCLETVAARMKEAIRMDESSLLLGERLSSIQTTNYAHLSAAASLASQWPSRSASLHSLLDSCSSQLELAARDALSAILATMHTDKSLRDASKTSVSEYMQELSSYVSRLSVHAVQSTVSLGRSEVMSRLAEHAFFCFLLHSSLLRPSDPSLIAKLRVDLVELTESLDSLTTPFGVASLAGRDDSVLSALFVQPTSQITWSTNSCVPAWIFCHLLIHEESPTELVSPHESVEQSPAEYVSWSMAASDEDRLRFLSNLLHSYAASVAKKGAPEYVTSYPTILQLLETFKTSIVIAK